MFRYIIVCVFLILSLTSCKPSYEDLVNDSDLRNKVLDDCAEKGLDAIEDELCTMAMKAKAEAIQKGINNLFSK